MPFYGGLAHVKKNGKHGFIEGNGNFKIEPIYYNCSDFQNGYARVHEDATSKGVFINQTGKVVLKNRNLLLSHHNEGLINCADEKGNWGFIDINENIVIPYQYKSARPFFEGKAAVWPKKNGAGKPNLKEKFSFINSGGDTLFPALFEGSDLRFSEGRCAIWDNNSYGYIDEKGNIVIPCDLDFGDHFYEETAKFKPKGKNSNYGFINKSGDIIIEAKFQGAGPFKNGLAPIITGEDYNNFLYGYVDKKGNYIWEPKR